MNSTLTVRVADVAIETDEIRSFELVPEAGGELPVFEAGAHIDVYTGDAGVRQYSLCNAPWERSRYVIGVKREQQGRGGSAWMHAQGVGARLTIGAPRNHFALDDTARRHVLLGAGIGVTPLIAMAETLWRRDADFTLCYFARSSAQRAFAPRLAQAPWRSRVRYHLDDTAPAIDLVAELAAAGAPATHAYMCGPQGFMDAVRRAAPAWPEANLHCEYFAPAAPARVHADQPFEVALARRGGETFHIGADETIAQVLLDAGIDITTSCEQGVCGTCVTGYLTGEPDHRDFCLSKKEREDKVALCCARSKTARLVLDL
ncbi:PDR/VanB family oxidoreductase [Caballeronia sp. INDeC2]|uniref:PDR/VanB family oxidoreductase n=1 Tax=Caballeronia sp. INDeC2 TaxID=2921747 RepID=UPI0020291EFB|nr:PDR/VanB family oxidoreductase [Caballeronia sp. INDeC2]